MSHDSVIFTVSIDNERQTISIYGVNEGNRTVETVVGVTIDGRDGPEDWFTISPGEEYHQTWNYSRDLNPTTDNHSIIVGTFGDNVKFSHYQEIDASSNSHVKKLHIESVKVINTSEGPAVNVTLSNPSIHLYPAGIVVKTEEDRGTAPGPVLSGESRTATIPLPEETPPHVAGEVRLYANEVDVANGSLDQKEFNGTIGGETTFRDEPYVPKGWDSYQYVPGPNNTANDPDVRQSTLPPTTSVAGESIPTEYAIGAAAGLIVVGLLFRRRR